MTPGIHKILVPTDFSEMSRYAVEYAAGLGRVLGAAVYVIHVIEPSYTHGVWDFYVPPSAEDEARQDTAARRDLARLVARLEHPAPPITTDLRKGPAADEIFTAARQFGADL